jgi:hypothetical protein
MAAVRRNPALAAGAGLGAAGLAGYGMMGDE